MQRIKVDLPLPLLPSTITSSPARTVDVDAFERYPAVRVAHRQLSEARRAGFDAGAFHWTF